MQDDINNSNSQKETVYNHPIRCRQCTKCKEWKPTNKFNKRTSSKDGFNRICKDCKNLYLRKRRNILNTVKLSQNNFGLLNPINFGYKKCTNCGELKLLSEFSKSKLNKDGFNFWCKVCINKYSEENKEKLRINKAIYYIEHKEEIKEYGIQYRNIHKDRKRESDQKYRKNNLEAIREYDRERNKTPKRRLQHKNNHHLRRMQVQATPKEDRLTLEQWNNILESQKNTCQGCGRQFNDELKPTIDHILPLSKGGDHTSANIQALCSECNNKKHANIDLTKIQSWIYITDEEKQ